MDTDALTLDRNEQTEMSLRTASASAPLRELALRMLSHPEFPDVLRDAAPFFSPTARKNVVKLAAVGEFLSRVNDAVPADGTEEAVRPMAEAFHTLKKYMPMDKRMGLDGMMSMMQGLRQKFTPKKASTPLESMIDRLTRLNELQKLSASAKTMRSMSDLFSQAKEEAPAEAPAMDPQVLLGLIGGMLGQDKAAQLKNMLSAFLPE